MGLFFLIYCLLQLWLCKILNFWGGKWNDFCKFFCGEKNISLRDVCCTAPQQQRKNTARGKGRKEEKKLIFPHFSPLSSPPPPPGMEGELRGLNGTGFWILFFSTLHTTQFPASPRSKAKVWAGEGGEGGSLTFFERGDLWNECHAMKNN